MEPDRRPLEEARRLLGNCVLFSGLDPEQRNAIVARARIRKCSAGDTIFSIGSPGENMMAILNGSVRISVPSTEGKELLITIFQPGEWFGEIALLDGKERTADAVAVTACTLGILERRDVLSFLEQNPGAWLKLVDVLCERLRRTDQTLADLALRPIPVRLAKTMLRIAAEKVGSARPPQKDLIDLSQRELANMVGGTRESVNKCLGVWQRDGWIQIAEGRILLKNRLALEELVDLG